MVTELHFLMWNLHLFLSFRGTFVEAFGQNWHPEHFVCAHCHENLQGKGVIEDKGKIYCEDDYMRLYAPKCSKCMKSITGVSSESPSVLNQAPGNIS